MKKHLLNYATYNLWANQRIVEWLLPHLADWEKPVTSSFPNIHLTLHHLFGAEWIWMERVTRQSPSGFPAVPAPKEVAVLLLDSSKKWVELMADVSDDWFEQTCQYSFLSGKSTESIHRDIVHHLFNHGTFHRGQLITMGRTLGLTDPPATDFIYFSRMDPAFL